MRSLKNMPVKTPLEVNLDLPWPAFLPRDYVPGQKLQIEVYRRLARVRKLDRLDDFRQELRDRFGPIPTPAEWLLRLAELRILASHWQIAGVHLEGKWSVTPLPLGEGPGVRVGHSTPIQRDEGGVSPHPQPLFQGERGAVSQGESGAGAAANRCGRSRGRRVGVSTSP